MGYGSSVAVWGKPLILTTTARKDSERYLKEKKHQIAEKIQVCGGL